LLGFRGLRGFTKSMCAESVHIRAPGGGFAIRFL
jgi:hypothetical protein